MYTKQILYTTTSIQTKYLTSGPKFILDLKKASQSGRSMVEMLGVLGIIGLLSVGGIATYQYLFSLSEANRISNKILTDYNRLISTAGRRLVVPEGFSDYAFVLDEDKQTLTVTVPGLESEVAQELMTNMGTRVSGQEFDDETGTLTLTFDIPNRRPGGRINRPLIPDNWEEDDKGNFYQTSCPPLTLTACTQAVAGRDGCNVVKEKPDGMECGAVEKGYSKMCFHGQCLRCQTAITEDQLKKGICSIEITAPCTAATLTAEGEPCGNEHGTCTDGVCKCNNKWEGVDCSYCPSPWEGDNCSECPLDCGRETQGGPNDTCTACECVGNWGGENCSRCDLTNCPADKPKLDKDTCACVACPADAPNWTGSECVSCTLTCAEGAIPNSDCTACECTTTGSDGKKMAYVNGTCVNYSSVCGDTFYTCQATCPDKCEVADGTRHPKTDATPGYRCENGECYCPMGMSGYHSYTTCILNDDGEWVNNWSCSGCDYDVTEDGKCYFGSNCSVEGRHVPGYGCVATFTDPICFEGYQEGEHCYSSACLYCYAAGTMISLADGTCKKVEDIDYDDELLVWDFDNGCFATAKPLFIKVAQESSSYNLLRFSDGSELKTIHQHRIFNIEAGKFTYPMTDDTPLGTHTFNANGEIVSLVSKEVIKKPVEYYNIITKHHLNCFANGILTSCRLNNMYPIRCMKFVKDDRTMLSDTDFPLLPAEWIDGLRLKEQPTDINRDGNVNFKDKSVQDYALRLMNVDKKFVAGKKEAA